jgi:starvation-inducible DNA-binding protein
VKIARSSYLRAAAGIGTGCLFAASKEIREKRTFQLRSGPSVDSGRITLRYACVEGDGIMSTHTSQSSKAAKTSNPDGFNPEQVKNLSSVLNALLADFFALYLKTKNFHWHMSGPHFRDYHLLLDDQGDQIFKATDDIAERVRKIGGETIRSIGHIARLQRITDNDFDFVPAHGMLEELVSDNQALVRSLREAHEVASDADDYATTSLIEQWIDEAERRAWFLFEATR